MFNTLPQPDRINLLFFAVVEPDGIKMSTLDLVLQPLLEALQGIEQQLKRIANEMTGDYPE